MTVPRAIGSVLPTPGPEPGLAHADSLWGAWTAGFPHLAAYASARSAIAAVLRQRGAGRVWLPAYVCAAAAAAAGPLPIAWYGVDQFLAPDTDDLAAGLAAGDAVLAVDYYGRSPPAGFLRLVQARRDVLWIEDRAQALAPDGPAWGDVVVYSPRKLVGVAEGGLAVSRTPLPRPGKPGGPPPSDRAQRARAADPDGRRPQTWFPAFQAQEDAFAVDDRPMAAATEAALREVGIRPLADTRRANARTLAAELGEFALWPDDGLAFAPLAFPIRVEDAATVSAAMARDRVFCARHWARLPSPPSAFPQAASLSATLLSLPCDHRYGADDMTRIADLVRTLARPYGGAL